MVPAGTTATATSGAGGIGNARATSLAALTLSTRLAADEPKLPRMKAELGLRGPVLHDKFELMAELYGVRLPRTFLLDASGRVRAIYGMEGDDLEDLIVAKLKGVLAPPAALPPVSAK